MLAPWKKSYDKSRQCIKNQRHYFVNKGLYSQSYGFSSSHVWMWELDHKEGWALKNWCFRTVVLEKTLESPLDCKEIKQVNLKGNQCWLFTGRTDAETKAPILRASFLEKTLMLGRTEGRRRRDNRGWDVWMASLTQWTWIWANSGRQWRTEEPGMLQSMASQRVRHDLVIEQPPHQNYKTSHCKNIQHIFSLMLRSTDCLIHCSFWRSCCGRTHHQEPWKCQSDEVTAT